MSYERSILAHSKRRLRWNRWRFEHLPVRVGVPWQPEDHDGPYLAWRWCGRYWFKRPWADGMTEERYERARKRLAASRSTDTEPLATPASSGSPVVSGEET